MAKRVKRKGRLANGLLLIDKAKGCSSFDVIRDLRRQTNVRKMGHTGTLDPMATGLMVVCLGEGTKLVQYLTADDKTYEAEVTFGVSTDSYDAEGTVISRNEPHELDHLESSVISKALKSFLGAQVQTPPAFSAIKVNGERLYEKARRGEHVDVPTRDVTFHQLEPISYEARSETEPLPKFKFIVRCSKGTYIRSLASDLGERLDVYAHLSGLRRTAAGDYSITDATPVEAITSESLDQHLKPLVSALPSYPLITLNEAEVIRVRQGKSIRLPKEFASLDIDIYRAQSPLKRLVALLRRDINELKVIRGFNDPLSFVED